MIIIVWLAGLIVCMFCFVVFFGAPYVPTRREDLENVFLDIVISKNATIVDLGSGDGKFLLMAAQRGYIAIGYELNPILWLISVLRLRRYKSASVKLQSFWRADLSQADLVFCFLATKFMPKLEKTLESQMKPKSYLASYVFALPHRKLIKKNKNTYFYQF